MKHFLLLLILFTVTQSFGQRHLKGQKTIDLLIGKTIPGYYTEANYGMLISSNSYLKFGGGAEVGELTGVNYTSMFLNAGYYHLLYELNQTFFFKGGAGLTGTLDLLHGGLIENNPQHLDNHFNYGLFLGVEVDSFINDHWAITTNIRQNFLLTDEPGTLVFYGGVGVKYVMF